MIHRFRLFTFLILLFLICGCGGGGGGGITPSLPGDTATAEIGPEGGILTVNGAELRIPQGSLSDKYTIELKRVSAPSDSPELVSNVYELEVNSESYISLNQQAQLELAFDTQLQVSDISGGIKLLDIWLPTSFEYHLSEKKAILKLDWLPGIPSRDRQNHLERKAQDILRDIELKFAIIRIFNTQSNLRKTTNNFRIYSEEEPSQEYLNDITTCAENAYSFSCDPNYMYLYAPDKYNQNDTHYFIVIHDLSDINALGAIISGLPGVIMIDKEPRGKAVLQETLCHEFFHLIQHKYGAFLFNILYNWLLEGPAAMIGGWGRQCLFDGYSFYDVTKIELINYPFSEHGREISNNMIYPSYLYSNDPQYMYDGHLFYSYLVKNYGLAFIRNFLSLLETNPLEIDKLKLLENAIKYFKPQQTLEGEYKGFCRDYGRDGCIGESNSKLRVLADIITVDTKWLYDNEHTLLVKPLGINGESIILNQGKGTCNFKLTLGNDFSNLDLIG